MKNWRPWLWAALAVLPPELLARAQGWSLVDPAFVAIMILWWPADLYCRLAILHSLLSTPTLRQPWQVLPGALASEVLLSLRLASVALIGLAPVAALFAYIGVETLPDGLLLIALACLGLLPALAYYAARSLTPILLLQEPLSAGAALKRSARLVQGAWQPFLKAMLPWLVASWTMDGLPGTADYLLEVQFPEALVLGLGVFAIWLEVQGLKAAWIAVK